MQNLYIKTVIPVVLVIATWVQAQDTVNQALENLSHRDSQIRCQAAEALGRISSQQDQVIQALRQTLGDKDHGVRGHAALALYRLGPQAVEKAGMMGHTGYDPIESLAAVALLEKAWTVFNDEYPMFSIREKVDWDALRDRYLAQARSAKSAQETAILIAQMLRHLQDGHVWIRHKGKNIPVFKVLAELNVNKNTRIYEGLLGRIHPTGKGFMWAKTSDHIGWVMFTRWSGADLPDQFDEVMEQMRDTRGLIVDVRWNGGGDAELSKYIASRFVDRTRVYSHYQHRNGHRRMDLTTKIAQTISPRGPWTYDRPVILLMGQGCVSACESFCAMMAACPNVTTMGDHTRGSTGFPVPFRLGHEIEIHVPQWIVTLPNGQLVDGQGIRPDIAFTPKADSFTGERDALLALALDRLGQEPLPTKSIQGPTVHVMHDKEQADKIYRPKLVSVEPKEGTFNVTPDTELRLRFDRPMQPSMLQMVWQAGGFHTCGPLRYDAENYEFTIPIKLHAGCQQRILINPPDPDTQKGFQSTYHSEAESHTWTFSTGAETQKATGAQQPAVSPPKNEGALRAVIAQFNETRKGMWALAETVRTLEFGRPGTQGYRHLRAYTTKFTVNGERQLCANVGEKRGMPLLVFSEGNLNHISGYYQKTPAAEEIVFCFDADVTERKIVVANPFQARNPNVDAVIRNMDLQYGGGDTLHGQACNIIHKARPQTQYWIDQQSHLLVKMVTHRNDGTKVTSEYAYEHINEPLNFMAYMPSVSYQWVCAHKQMVPTLDEGAHRYIEMKDGTCGPVDVKWGKHTAQGRESIGL